MTKLEDHLFAQLMAEHGHQLRAVRRPAMARRRAWRPAWLATGGAGAVAAVAAAVMALGTAPAVAAYSVTRHDGSVTVSVYRASGVAGANAALHRMHTRVVVVAVRPGCPPIGSLPRPRPVPHPGVRITTGVNRQHRSISVEVNDSIPAGDTLLLAFSAASSPGSTALTAAGIITGRVPRCVSLPSALSGRSGSSSTRTVTRDG